MEILVNVFNQKLKIETNLKTLVEGSQKFIKFVFNLDEAWDNLTVFAQFRQGDVAYNKYLENNSVYLPIEITAGTCDLLLYGVDSEVIATTNYVTLTISDNRLLEDASSTDFSQTIYQQIIAQITETEQKVSEIRNTHALDVQNLTSCISELGTSLSEVDNKIENLSDNMEASLSEKQSKSFINIVRDFNADNTGNQTINNALAIIKTTLTPNLKTISGTSPITILTFVSINIK